MESPQAFIKRHLDLNSLFQMPGVVGYSALKELAVIIFVIKFSFVFVINPQLVPVIVNRLTSLLRP